MTQIRFTIGVMKNDGWVRIFLARGEPTGESAKFLSEALKQWMNNNPHVRVRMILPITSNGDTSELHAWYDQLPVPVRKADAGKSPQ